MLVFKREIQWFSNGRDANKFSQKCVPGGVVWFKRVSFIWKYVKFEGFFFHGFSFERFQAYKQMNFGLTIEHNTFGHIQKKKSIRNNPGSLSSSTYWDNRL